MTPDERLYRYAELVVRVGANVQPGQEVAVLCQVEHADTARAVTREAYRAGAKRVIVQYGDQHLRRAAIELGPAEHARPDTAATDSTGCARGEMSGRR